MDFFEQVADVLTTVGRDAADKANNLAEIVNLKSQVTTCENIVKKNYIELGRLYYETYGENPDPAFEKQCRSIRNAKHGAEELSKRIDGLKGL